MRFLTSIAALLVISAASAADITKFEGTVTCDGTPIQGVPVSDGINVTFTDAKGRYSLSSDNKYGSLYITNPKGYSVEGSFYRNFDNGNLSKRTTADFSLIRDNSADNGHVIMAFADIHLANKCNDLAQYSNIFIPDVNAVIDSYRKQGKKVYAITLGDQSWDRFWYANDCTLERVDPYLAEIKADRLYNCMGNHDNDVKFLGHDHEASAIYRKIWGPTHYSFNIGDIHYVVLDNIIYENTSDPKFNFGITDDQIDWLRQDLSAVTDKSTPIVVCFHAALFQRAKADNNGRISAPTLRPNFKNRDEFIDALKDFSNIQILSGHAHVNENKTDGRITEYNVANVGATWWYTGRRNIFLGPSVASDGTGGGYLVQEVNGRDYTTYYKTISHGRDYQFRAYDLNECRFTPESFCPDAPYANDLKKYLRKNPVPDVENGVLINVWGYDSRWKVEAYENGKPLEVTRVMANDPMRIYSGAIAFLNAGCRLYDDEGKLLDNSFNVSHTCHMFLVKASRPDSSVDIKVTDASGRVYQSRMDRPYAIAGIIR